MLLGLTCGLLAAICQSLCYLVSGAYARRSGLPAWTLTAPANAVVLVPSAVLAWAFWPTSGVDWAPLVGLGVACTAFGLWGNLSCFQMQRTVDASRVAPLMTLKVPVLALWTWVLAGRNCTATQWCGIALALASAGFLCGAGRRISPGAWAWLLACSVGFALSDFCVGAMLEKTAPHSPNVLANSLFTLGLMQFFASAVSLPLLFATHARAVARQIRLVPPAGLWLRHAVPFGFLWLLALSVLLVCFSLCTPVLGTIVQSTRGVISVLIGHFVARCGNEDLEERVSRATFARRLAAAAGMIGAMALYAWGS